MYALYEHRPLVGSPRETILYLSPRKDPEDYIESWTTFLGTFPTREEAEREAEGARLRRVKEETFKAMEGTSTGNPMILGFLGGDITIFPGLYVLSLLNFLILKESSSLTRFPTPEELEKTDKSQEEVISTSREIYDRHLIETLGRMSGIIFRLVK